MYAIYALTCFLNRIWHHFIHLEFVFSILIRKIQVITVKSFCSNNFDREGRKLFFDFITLEFYNIRNYFEKFWRFWEVLWEPEKSLALSFPKCPAYIVLCVFSSLRALTVCMPSCPACSYYLKRKSLCSFNLALQPSHKNVCILLAATIIWTSWWIHCFLFDI